VAAAHGERPVGAAEPDGPGECGAGLPEAELAAEAGGRKARDGEDPATGQLRGEGR
jgi:hypothetical protein